MSKERNFGDLKPGDTIWKEDHKNWQIIPLNIIKLEKINKDPDYVRIYISNSLNFKVSCNSFYYDLMHIWSDKEKLIDNMRGRAIRMEPYYIDRIDELISQYDSLIRWRKSLEI